MAPVQMQGMGPGCPFTLAPHFTALLSRVHALGGDNQLAFRKGCKVTKERLTN